MTETELLFSYVKEKAKTEGIPFSHMISAFLMEEALRILAECAPPSPLPETPAAVEAEYEGGQLYLALTARKEADDERAP